MRDITHEIDSSVVCCVVLRCVALCCSVLQCEHVSSVVCCSGLQGVAV